MTQIYLAHNGLTRNQEYDDRGRIISSYLNTTSGGASALSYRYQYDNYGNRTAKTYYYGSNTIQSYEWERGRLLKNIKNTSGGVVGAYTYDVNGVRYTKTANGVTTTYFYDGNTLLGENRSDGKRLRYFYDATGLCGFSYYNGNETKYYTYVKDVLGNIVMIKDDMGLPLVKYTYNEWGVCSMTAFNLDNQGAAVLELGNLNPFRYRGYYYDTESGLYYLMSRYYDPEIGQFISMDTSDYLAPETIGGVDLYAYGLNNPVMYVDPTGHEVELWQGILAGIGVALILTAAALAIFGTGGVFAFGIGALIGATAVGAIGAGVGATVGYLTGGVDGILGGALAGFGIGAIVGFVVGGAIGTSTYSSALGTNFGKMGTVVKHPGIKVDWSQSMIHGPERMLQRGVTKRLVNSTVRKGIALSQTGGKFAFITRKAVAVVSASGILITTYGEAFYDAGMLEIIKVLFGG